MERFKILFITSWYPTEQEPVIGIFVREHALAVQRYDDVEVMHIAGIKEGIKGLWGMESEKDERLHLGIPTYRVSHRRSPIPKTSYFVHLWSLYRSFQALMAQGFRPDIIHAHVFTAGFPAILLGRLARLPVLISEHYSGFPRRLLSPLDILIARFTFQHAAAVLPVSLALQHGIEAYGIRANFQVVPNVADPVLFHRPISSNGKNGLLHRILFVGNLVPVKGILDLLNCLPRLKSVRDDWRLDIVGDGTEREEYEATVRKLDLAEYVVFHGRKPKEAVAEFMRQSDFFVLPSHWDNSPCVIVEAMASGLPIVATQVGGIPEFVSEDIGILVPPGNPTALTEALQQMLVRLSEFDREKIARKAQAYTPEMVGQMMHSIYRRFV